MLVNRSHFVKAQSTKNGDSFGSVQHKDTQKPASNKLYLIRNNGQVPFFQGGGRKKKFAEDEDFDDSEEGSEMSDSEFEDPDEMEV